MLVFQVAPEALCQVLSLPRGFAFAGYESILTFLPCILLALAIRCEVCGYLAASSSEPVFFQVTGADEAAAWMSFSQSSELPAVGRGGTT